MHTVKRLEKDTILERTEVNGNLIKAVGKKTARRCYAVVDENGNVTTTVDRLTGEPVYNIFPHKYTAQELADWMNK